MTKISDYLYKKASINKIPLNGVFELSPVCNLNCRMCYVRKTPEQIKTDGKCLKEWTEWITLAKACKEEGMLYLLLTGGEPFIFPDFKKLYAELHKLGLLISINTNGTMINRETVEWLKTMAPTCMNVTLYGANSDTYEKICGVKDGYERAKQAILMLKEAGIQVIVNASMIPENADDLEDIICFGKMHDVFVRVSTYMFPPIRRKREINDSRFTAEKSAEMFLRKQKCIMETKNYQQFLMDTLQKVYNKSEVDADTWGTNLEYMRCRAGRSSFWVSWEGAMTACGMLPFPIVVFPFEQAFHECWMRLTNKVRTTKVLAACKSCEKKEVCNPCVAMLYSEVGDVNSKSEYLCGLTDQLIKKMRKELQEIQENE